MAILAGDFLLARASISLAKLGNFEVTEIMARVISDLVEGEFMQMKNSAEHALDYDYYLQVHQQSQSNLEPGKGANDKNLSRL